MLKKLIEFEDCCCCWTCGFDWTWEDDRKREKTEKKEEEIDELIGGDAVGQAQ